jgi:3',5'-cyclic AMP phosphodiesterase CpdA
MNRRDFLLSGGVAALSLTLGRTLTFAGTTQPADAAPAGPAKGVVRAGVITDLHHLSFGKDEITRLRTFMDAVVTDQPDFILQGGDFCYPAGAAAAMAEWNRFAGDKYHVLGNHDMDKCDKATIMKLWEMPRRYYSFDKGAFHFIVLDRNCIRRVSKPATGPSVTTTVDYAQANYGRAKTEDLSWCDAPQIAWLAEDLRQTDKPTVVFAHQPLVATDAALTMGGGDQLVGVFDAANYAARRTTGRPRVVAAFFGHDHEDRYAERNGIHYVELNSASYFYDRATGANYYRDSLFSFITFDPAGSITIEGRNSDWAAAATPDTVRERTPPRISSRSMVVNNT